MCSETNLYGDWMVVQPRRRGASYSARKVFAGLSSTGQCLGSRFGVLAYKNLEAVRDTSIAGDDRDGTVVAGERTGTQQNRVEQHQNVSRVEGNVVARSAAYLASKPDKKKKKVSSKQLGSVEVVPTVVGTDSTIVNHMPVVSSGSHAAVRILEKINESTIPHRKDVPGHQTGLDRVGGVVRKGSCIRKPMNSGKGGLGVVEWMKSAHARIDSIGKQPNEGSGSYSIAMDESHNECLPSDDEEIWEEDELAHMSDVGDAVAKGGMPSEFINFAVVDSELKGKVHLTAVYASPSSVIRKHLWNHLLHLRLAAGVPWGDRNTKFYHARVKERRRRNYVSALRREDDSWATNPAELKNIALTFYKDLFTSDKNSLANYSTRGRFLQVNRGILEHLGDPMSEIEQSLFGRDSRLWDLIFGATCWYLWLYRNGLVYSTDGTETWSVLAKVRGWYKEHAASLLLSNGRAPAVVATGLSGSGSYHSMRRGLTHWCPSSEGWYKLNTDGSGGRGSG
ncbi:hypothetical protein V6N11_050134 [Hibiscus sabdariffa]|uniref:Uncharacterized protein n=1 Tax=Hibiscus sabdariffa TaxID=183260 RepID=A0ABR2T8Z9_9ROSI